MQSFALIFSFFGYYNKHIKSFYIFLLFQLCYFKMANFFNKLSFFNIKLMKITLKQAI